MAIREGRTEPKIGPSDTTDTFYDNPEGVTDSDNGGTGERGPASDRSARGETRNETSPDRVVDSKEVGLGGGLDEAEEARLGVTDEELARRKARREGS
ncbi:MAG TPA: hypothetical protein VEB41_08690 [Burkholderiales bacterium]|nr:hypothetical protein [Burkholderiales bacterium]